MSSIIDPFLVDQYKEAMRSFPASVSVIATGDKEHRTGLTATAVCSLSAEPPQIIVCLNAKTGTFNSIKESRYFSVNVLQAEQEALAKCFGGFDPNISGEQRFSKGCWHQGLLGVPILKGAILTFECSLVEALPAQTHFILVGAVKQIHKSAQAPMAATLLYADGAFGQLSPLAHEALL